MRFEQGLYALTDDPPRSERWGERTAADDAPGSGAGATPPAVLRAHLALVLPLLLAGLVAYAGIGPVRTALEMFALAGTANPYFIPRHAALLYFVVPVATLALAVFVMAPGLLLAAGIGRARGPAEWLLAGLALSLALLVPATALAQLAPGVELRGGGFLALVALVCLAVLPFPLRRLLGGRMPAVELAGRGADLVFALLVPLAALLLFSAKFYWENFSPDGYEGLQLARLFSATLWPFWPEGAGTVRGGAALTSALFALPGSWFLRAWGEYEFAARAPMLLWLGLLHPVVMALIRHGRAEAVRLADHLLVSAILILYTLALVYSGGYHPWFNDSPLPAARETLALVLFLGYALFLFTGRTGWMAAFAFLSFLVLPTGAMWIVLVPLAAWLVWRTEPRPPVAPALVCAAAVAAFALVAPLVIRLLDLPMPGGEFDPRSIANRIRYVALADWERFAFLLVPCGIVPAAALFAWKRQDSLARTLTLVAAAIFLFFYLQGYRVLLHHFAPVMLLPAIVYWRTLVLPATRPLVPRLAALAGIALATLLAWPNETRLHTVDRALGQKIFAEGPRFELAGRMPGAGWQEFDPVAVDIVHELLRDTFRPDYSPDAPAERFFGGPFVWYYYANFPKDAGSAVNYHIRPLAAPGEGTAVARYHGYGMFVRDMEEYRRDRTRRLPYGTGSPLLATSREVIFGRGAQGGGRLVIDLLAIPRALFDWPPEAPAVRRGRQDGERGE